MQKAERANGGTNSKGSNQKNVNAGAISKSFDVFDFTQNIKNSQQICGVCNPSNKNQSTAKLCDKCAEKSDTLATEIFGHLQQNRKVVRLQRCLSCNGYFAPSKFSQFYGICKTCVSGVQEKSKAARSNFIARTVNNFHKMLKGVAAL